MNEIIEWLKGIDYTTLYAMLGTFVATYGGSIIALVIGLLKQKTKTFNYQKVLEKMQIELEQKEIEKIESLKTDIVGMLNDMQKDINTKNIQANEERMKVITTIADETTKSIEDLKELTTDEALKGLN